MLFLRVKVIQKHVLAKNYLNNLLYFKISSFFKRFSPSSTFYDEEDVGVVFVLVQLRLATQLHP